MTTTAWTIAALCLASGWLPDPVSVHDLTESGNALVFERGGDGSVIVRAHEDPHICRPRIELIGPPGTELRLVFEGMGTDWDARAWQSPGRSRTLTATSSVERLEILLDLRRGRELIELVPLLPPQSASDEASSYSYADHLTFMATLPADPRLEVVNLGSSVEGRPIQKIVFDDKSAIMPAFIKPTVVLLIRQHGDESPASYVFEGMINHLLGPTATPQETEQVRWVIYPLVNPDGAYHNDRYNTHGIDLNRNWSAFGPQPWQEPETWLVQSDLAALPYPNTVRIVGDHHGWWSGADGGYRYAEGIPPAAVAEASYLESLKDTNYITAYNPAHWAWYENGGTEGMARVELHRWLGWTVHTPEYDRGSRDEELLRESGASCIRAMRDTGYALTEESVSVAIGDPVAFSLDEPGENFDPLQIESLTVLVLDYVTGDRERAVLDETGANSGLFSFASALPTATGTAQRFDGTLQTAVGSYAIGYYADPDLASDRSIAGILVTP